VGTNGVAADPLGNVTYTIRGQLNDIIPNCLVTIDFSGCPQIRLCRAGGNNATVTCVGPNGQGKVVSGWTGANGSVTFAVVGSVDQATYQSNADFPPNPPPCPSPGTQDYLGCATVTVTAPGFPPINFPNLIVSAADHTLMDNGVGSGDLARCLADLVTNRYRERSDYDTSLESGGAGCLNSGDLSMLISIAVRGGSTRSCTPAQGGTPCP
jgi:hypothetical protein